MLANSITQDVQGQVVGDSEVHVILPVLGVEE